MILSPDEEQWLAKKATGDLLSRAGQILDIASKCTLVVTAVGSGLGFCIFLRYCYSIQYLPNFSLHDAVGSLFGLAFSGIFAFLLVTIYPFTPGLLLWIGGGTGRLTKEAGARGVLAILSVFVVAVYSGLLGVLDAYAHANGSLGRFKWVEALPSEVISYFAFAFIVISVGLFALSAEEVRNKMAPDARVKMSAGKIAGALAAIAVAELTLMLIMLTYGAIVLRIAELTGPYDPMRYVNIIFPIVIIVTGIITIGNSGEKHVRSRLPWIIVLFSAYCLVMMSDTLSTIAMHQFRLGSYGPVEIVVKNENIENIPTAIRGKLHIQPISEANGKDKGNRQGFFSVKNAYVLLRVGSDYRFGVLTDPTRPRSWKNPIDGLSGWNIPASDIVSIQELPTAAGVEPVTGVK